MIFEPKRCLCGCGKWIMHPWFGCQCSSLSTEEKDELMDVARDAMRYRELRKVGVGDVQPLLKSTIAQQCTLDAVCDILDRPEQGISMKKSDIHIPFPIPTQVTLQVNTYNGKPHDYEIPELHIRVGPLYDGSGLRDQYPDGVIRTVAGAGIIAQMIVDMWNSRSIPA